MIDKTTVLFHIPVTRWVKDFPVKHLCDLLTRFDNVDIRKIEDFSLTSGFSNKSRKGHKTQKNRMECM